MQMWQGCAQSRCRCGWGAPSLGADVGGVGPVSGDSSVCGPWLLSSPFQACSRHTHGRAGGECEREGRVLEYSQQAGGRKGEAEGRGGEGVQSLKDGAGEVLAVVDAAVVADELLQRPHAPRVVGCKALLTCYAVKGRRLSACCMVYVVVSMLYGVCGCPPRRRACTVIFFLTDALCWSVFSMISENAST